LWIAIAVGVVLRGLPIVLWPFDTPIRDEVTYTLLADSILAGEGLTGLKGWLWAPGYPHLLALFQWAFDERLLGTVTWLQVFAASVGVWLSHQLGARIAGPRAALIAAWLYALHPTLAFYAGRLWSESIYSPLLLAAVASLLWAREGRPTRGLLPGALVGLCVLLRGVATYMGPLFFLAAIWPSDAESPKQGVRRRWPHAVILLLAMALTVAPYSLYASARSGGFILSDATLGQMMYLGNNEFPPMSFDVGNGSVRNHVRDAWFETGRAHCDVELPVAAWDACEVDRGKAWIRDNPGEFLARIPLRLAQLVHPHTFLTRHLRWGRWPQLPFLLKEGLCLWVVVWSYVVLVGGTVAACARARGPYGMLAVTIVAYHVAAIAALAGLSRYRLPLEPLWMIYLAMLLAHPRVVLGELGGSTARAAGALLTLPMLFALMLWYLPTGFPMFW
jgi:hypothetical protein